jgi:APA family basic amino acid/polyamine antiporter
LILEYTVVCAAVAVGWSSYAGPVLTSWGVPISQALLAGPSAGGIVNVPAIVISLAVAGLLVLGSRESTTVNLILVVVKLAALATFIALALPAFNADNFTPFMPYGFGDDEVDGVKRGVMAAAAVIFFAFYGFDAVSTAAEEAKNPGRDLKIGIVGSMLLCTLLYMAVAAAALGGADYKALADSGEPLALVLRNLNHPDAARLIALAAVIALPTVIMAFMYGQSRIFFVMARDGMLPQRLSSVSKRTGSPVAMTLVTGIIVAIIAGLLPLKTIAELANAGTLIAFIAVALCMMIMRVRAPQQPRVFATPLPWVVGPLTILGCVYLFTSLPYFTMRWFAIWTVIGLLVYFVYAKQHSALASPTKVG